MNQYSSAGKCTPHNSAKPDIPDSRRRTVSGSGPDSAIFHFVPSAGQGGGGNVVQRNHLQAYPGPARFWGFPQTSITTMRRLWREIPAVHTDAHQYAHYFFLRLFLFFTNRIFEGESSFCLSSISKKFGFPDKALHITTGFPSGYHTRQNNRGWGSDDTFVGNFEYRPRCCSSSKNMCAPRPF